MTVYALLLEVAAGTEQFGVKIGGLTVRARLEQSFEKLGIRAVNSEEVSQLVKAGETFSLLLARCDRIYDLEILRLLAASNPGTRVVDGTPPEPIGLALVPAPSSGTIGPNFDAALAELAPLAVRSLDRYDEEMRKVSRPRWFDPSRAPKKEIEDYLLNAANKGTNDWISLYLHPWPQNLITRWLWRVPFLTPNVVTIFNALISLWAVAAFASGEYVLPTVWGNMQGIMDGVDGKLARTTLRFSKLGSYLDHVIDQIYEPLWYLAIGWALQTRVQWPIAPFAVAWLFLAFYFTDRIATGWFRIRNGVQLHDYRKLDRCIRTYGARRNTVLLFLLAGVVVNRFPESFALCTTYMALTAFAHIARFIWIEWKGLMPETSPR